MLGEIIPADKWDVLLLVLREKIRKKINQRKIQKKKKKRSNKS
jgi:hypothetical protein